MKMFMFARSRLTIYPHPGAGFPQAPAAAAPPSKVMKSRRPSRDRVRLRWGTQSGTSPHSVVFPSKCSLAAWASAFVT